MQDHSETTEKHRWVTTVTTVHQNIMQEEIRRAPAQRFMKTPCNHYKCTNHAHTHQTWVAGFPPHLVAVETLSWNYLKLAKKLLDELFDEWFDEISSQHSFSCLLVLFFVYTIFTHLYIFIVTTQTPYNHHTYEAGLCVCKKLLAGLLRLPLPWLPAAQQSTCSHWSQGLWFPVWLLQCFRQILQSTCNSWIKMNKQTDLLLLLYSCFYI